MRLTSGHLTYTPGGHLAICGDFPICCDGGPPDTVTLSGGTGCFAIFNGTFAMTVAVNPCNSEFIDTIAVPGNPCTAGTHCAATTEIIGFISRTVYHYPFAYGVEAYTSNTDGTITIQIGANLGWYYIDNFGNCITPGIPTRSLGATYTRSTCRSGDWTPSGSEFFGTRPSVTGLTFPP